MDPATRSELLAHLQVEPVPVTGTTVDDADLLALLELAPTATLELAFLVLRDTALRPHELLSVRLENVRDEGGSLELIVPETNPTVPSGRNKTGGRVVPVVGCTARLRGHLARLARAGKPAATRLFPYANKTLSVTFCRMKARFAAEHGRPFVGRLYGLRHTRITELYAAGVPDQVVRRVVGWTPASKMPDVYVHITGKTARACLQQVPGLLADFKGGPGPGEGGVPRDEESPDRRWDRGA